MDTEVLRSSCEDTQNGSVQGASSAEKNRNHDSESFVGRLIDGKYRILSEIVNVGSHVILLGLNERTNKRWSIKAINMNDPLVKDNMKFLLEEPYMLMQFDHPAIPKVVDIVQEEPYVYIIRECLEGETLGQAIEKRGPVPADTAVAWAIQLCEALQVLHTHNPPYIFRDMKPQNVILQPNGSLKIVGFDLAMVYDPQKKDKTVMGTRGYSSPEQYAGASDFRSDIFSLGMTLHYMLTGVDPCKPPYEVQPIRMINPALPYRLEQIVNRCIQPDPADRFQSCEELLNALKGGPICPPKKKGFFEKLFGKKLR